MVDAGAADARSDRRAARAGRRARRVGTETLPGRRGVPAPADELPDAPLVLSLDLRGGAAASRPTRRCPARGAADALASPRGRRRTRGRSCSTSRAWAPAQGPDVALIGELHAALPGARAARRRRRPRRRRPARAGRARGGRRAGRHRAAQRRDRGRRAARAALTRALAALRLDERAPPRRRRSPARRPCQPGMPLTSST